MGIRARALKTLIFGKPKNEEPKERIIEYAPSMSGYTPAWSDFGSNIYASDIIVQAIRCKANELKKLKPRHIRSINGKQTVITDSSIARCLKEPNELMTQTEFFEKITILLELNKNVFIYPMYFVTQGGEKYYTGLYPLRPTNVKYLQDKSGTLFIKFTFSNGYRTILPKSEVIHWRKDYGVDDYFGGNLGNEKRSLMKLLNEYDKITQSIATSLNASTKINGIMMYNSYLDDDKMAEKQAEFNAKLLSNESGIMFTDNKLEYINLPRDVKLVDKDTMQYFYESILRNTGVSLAILNGDYTKAQKEAFYEHALEGDIKALGEAITKVVFTDREKSFGNEVLLYPNSIEFMSMENKLEAWKNGLPAGIFLKDEAREIIGYPPLPNGQGQVIAQGYNSLLDENNNNKLSKGGAKDEPKQDDEESEPTTSSERN